MRRRWGSSTAATDMPSARSKIGSDGRYTVLRRLGAGGMGDVFVARDERLGREVAVKFFKSLEQAPSSDVRRFEHEGVVLAGLRHPGLAQVFDTGIHDGVPFMVQELIPGQSLDRRILADDLLDEDEAWHLVTELADALSYVHDRNVVHRDIKPANIVVQPDGRTRLLDFGLARDEALTQLTMTGAFVGTVCYAPPEVLVGHPSTTASDVY